MPSITFSGAASGIDTGAIVDQIIAVASRPITQLKDRVTKLEGQKTAISDLRGRLSTLLTKVKALASISGLNARLAVASPTATNNKTVASVSVDSTAATGAFQVSVEQLATATKLQSTTAVGQPVTQNVALNSGGFSTTITTGTFKINNATITIDDNTVLSDGVDNGASNSILGKINSAGAGVTASIVNDAYGQPNLLQLTSGSAITLGSGGDTSNFLTAANLLASPGTTTRTSTKVLGQTKADVNLNSARFAVALSQNTGSFQINGVTITYDATNESLNGILSKINSSAAGVTANYDAQADTVILTANKTGSTAITLQDVSGDFLAATRVLSATQTLGQNAGYKINGGATQYSSSNLVANALPGVTLNLLQAVPGDNSTVTVSANDEAIVSAVKGFVEQYNSTMTLITDFLKVDPEGKSNGKLAGDATLRLLAQSLRSKVVGFADNLTTQFTSLSDIGVTFGAVGAAVGTANTLQLDETKLRAKITADRNAVIEVLAAISVTAAFVPGTGSILSATGTPDKVQPGTYRITDNGSGSLTVQFDLADGSTQIIGTGTITAGGTNTTLIPGMTLTAKATLQAGYDEIVVTRTKAGMGVKLQEIVDAQLRTNGALGTKSTTFDDRIKDFNAQITKLEGRLATQQKQLETKFAAMEQIFARFQSQRLALENFATALSQNRRR